MEHWTGLLDCVIFLFGQVSEFIFGSLLFMIYKYQAIMDDCNNDNSYLLQCFHKYINNLNTHLKMMYIANYSRWKSFMAFAD